MLRSGVCRILSADLPTLARAQAPLERRGVGDQGFGEVPGEVRLAKGGPDDKGAQDSDNRGNRYEFIATGFIRRG